MAKFSTIGPASAMKMPNFDQDHREKGLKPFSLFEMAPVNYCLQTAHLNTSFFPVEQPADPKRPLQIEKYYRSVVHISEHSWWKISTRMTVLWGKER